MIAVEKKNVARTGKARLGWFLGKGYVTETMTVKTEKWCVLRNGKILAECQGKVVAEEIAEAFEWIGQGV